MTSSNTSQHHRGWIWVLSSLRYCSSLRAFVYAQLSLGPTTIFQLGWYLHRFVGQCNNWNLLFFSQSVVVLLLASYIRPNFGHITGSSSSQTNGLTFHREFIVDPMTERSPGQIIMPPLDRHFLTVGMRCCVWFSPNVRPCIMAKHSVQMALLGVFVSRFVQLQPHGPKPFCHVLWRVKRPYLFGLLLWTSTFSTLTEACLRSLCSASSALGVILLGRLLPTGKTVVLC